MENFEEYFPHCGKRGALLLEAFGEGGAVVGEEAFPAELEERVLHGVAGGFEVAGQAVGVLAQGSLVAGDGVLDPLARVGIHRVSGFGAGLAAGGSMLFLAMVTDGRGVS